MLKRVTGGSVAGQDIMGHFDAAQTWLSYLTLSAPGLVIGSGSAAKVKIANTVNYLFNGVFKSKTTAEVAFTAVTHDIAANATLIQEQVYLVCLDGSGTPSLVAGGISSGSGSAVLPERPANLAVIGSCRIAVAAGATSFVAATTLLSNGALTVTYTDLAFVAPRFDISQ